MHQAELPGERAGAVKEEDVGVGDQLVSARREEPAEHRDVAVEGERLREEALVLDDDVELPDDDKHVVIGLCAEEVCGPQPLLEHRVEELREARQGEALIELLQERGGLGPVLARSSRRYAAANSGRPKTLPTAVTGIFEALRAM